MKRFNIISPVLCTVVLALAVACTKTYAPDYNVQV